MTFEEFQRRWVSARLSQYPIAPAPIPSMPLPLLPPAPPKPNYEVERLKSLNRGGWRCQYCRTKATEVDHVVPRSEGGPDWSWNLVAACGDCNKAAGDLLFPNVEAKRRYIRWGHRRVQTQSFDATG